MYICTVQLYKFWTGKSGTKFNTKFSTYCAHNTAVHCDWYPWKLIDETDLAFGIPRYWLVEKNIIYMFEHPH
jgi:hypothetical protein